MTPIKKKKEDTIQIDSIEPTRLFESVDEDKSLGFDWDGMKQYYSEHKKLVIGTLGAVVIASYVGLVPMGGLDSFKTHVTKPLTEKITGLKEQNKQVVNEKNKAIKEKNALAKDYESVKKEKEAYVKEMSKYKDYSADADFMNMLYEVYDPKVEYKVVYNFDNGTVIKTKAIHTGKVVEDVKKNMMWCASRLKFEMNGIRKYLGDKWADEYHNQYIHNNSDFVMNESDKQWGKDGYLGNWTLDNDGDWSFNPKKKLPVKSSEKDGLENYFK